MINRRRPPAATFVAVLVTLALGSQVGLAAPSTDRDAPDPVRAVEVTATDRTTVTIAWPPARDRVAGYGIYVDGTRVGTETPDRLKWWRDRQSLTYTIRDLTCGKGYTVGVDVFERDDNRSSLTTTTVSTSACPDTTPPSAPAGARQVAATETSVVLAWSPSTDNVGVVEYGLYASGLRVATVSEANATLTKLACGTSYLIGIDAADAAGNRSARSSSFFRTAACPSTNKPPTTPTGLKVAGATPTSVTLAWSASTDDVAVAGYGLYVSGSRRGQTTGTTSEFTGLECGKTYALGVDAVDAAGARSTVAELSAATRACAPPPSGTGTVKQTIANGATLSGVVNWRAVYDRNGDGVEDDPGAIEFLVDGKVVLTEDLIPFGDWEGHWTSTAVANGQHTFQVRAISGTGSVLATNTVTATVANGSTTPPPPPPPASGTVKQTIADGSTVSGVVNWRAVYDRNGDNVEDDPGSIRFLVDGKVVLTEDLIPFGDWEGFWSSSSVPNGEHTFHVQAVSGTGTVLASNAVKAKVANASSPPSGDTAAPARPGNLRVASATATAVTAAWSAATDNVGVAGYGLYRGSSQTGQTQQTSATYNGLSCGTAYQIGVDAYDAAGNRSSRADLAVTTAACADAQPPTAPTNVTASSRTATSITLTWAPATDNVGVTAYGIYEGGELVHTTAGTTGIVGGLACNTNYTLAVDAFDASGNSSSKTTVMVSTLPCADTTPPSQPSNLRATSTTTSSVALAWNASTDNVAVAGYDVLRAGTKVGSTSGTSYTVNGLSCATSYSLAVKALDAAGNASPQAALSVTTSPCSTPAPQNCTGYPDAGCTGVPDGTPLTVVNGGLTVSTPGAVIDGRDVRGCIRIEAASVTVRNSKAQCIIIDGAATSGARHTIVDTTIVCDASGWATGIMFGNVDARRVDISNCENGLDISSPSTVRDSYIHDLEQGGTNHTDGIQGSIHDSVIEHNTIYAFTGSAQGTSAIIASGAPGTNTLIQNNLLAGGAATLYCPRTSVPSFKVMNNRFSTISSPKVGVFYAIDSCSGETLSGNVIHETGAPIDGSSPPPPPPPPPPAPPPPPSGGFPDASNTGVPAGVTLTASGGMTISTAGAVVNGLDITGQVVVNAPNVTIRNSRIRSNSMWVIDNNSTGLVIEDSEILNRPVSGQNNCHNAIGDANFTLRRVDISGCENAANIGGDNVTIVDSYIHDLDTVGPSYVWGSDPHTDGLQMAPGADNIVVRHNTIDPSPGSGVTAPIIMGVNGSQNNIWIEDNYLDGRGAAYALYLPRQQSSNINVNRNRMYKGYGYTACARLGVTVATFSDNRDAGTGAVLPPDNGSDGGCSN